MHTALKCGNAGVASYKCQKCQFARAINCCAEGKFSRSRSGRLKLTIFVILADREEENAAQEVDDLRNEPFREGNVLQGNKGAYQRRARRRIT